MNEVFEDPLAKLEGILLDWDREFTASRRQVSSRLQSAKARLESAWSRAETAKAAVDAVCAPACPAQQFEELAADRARAVAALNEAQDRVCSLEKSLQRSYERVQTLERDRTELLLRVEELKQGKAGLAAQTKELAERIDELQRTLQDATSASNEVGTDTHAHGATEAEPVGPHFETIRSPEKVMARREPDMERQRPQAGLAHDEHERAHDVLTRRLAEALRDRDEAHQQIVELRAEVESLRKGTVVVSGEPAAGGMLSLDPADPGFTRLRLGQMLQRSGIVTAEHIEAALAAKKKAPQKPLGAILVELGFTDEAMIAKVLASQLNLPYVELDQRAIDPAAAALIPAKLARHHVCIPISVERGQLLVAMANPLDLIALEDLEIATRRRVDPVIATPTAIGNAIAQHYTAI